ncbi:response regulator [Pseudomonas typographi]|uniref:Response regulator n=1 Tax=Pseudomonas typographi TaxID=2715964 RepID=A0ABR7YX87_9PSED|nr:response regulator [Pseudomonas typographi]MBD1551182.1 response regulator [Pseudomonas typographi]MBD1586324.1 response regulator [Pseudomonas typographi]MBD1597796.1 response regulator [Pseudomonas typographi]
MPEHAKNKILVVEDELMIADLIRCAIKAEGIQAEAFERADDGMAYLRAHAEDILLIITDVKTPGQADGITLTRYARAHWPDIPVIISTAVALPDDLVALHGVGVLRKPWNIEDLVDVVLKSALQPSIRDLGIG